MSKNSLRSRTIRLASENKALRPHLLRALQAYEGDMAACGDDMGEGDFMAGRTWGAPDLFGGGKGNPGATPDDKPKPYNKRNLGPGGCNKGGQPGCDGTYAERLEYNKKYRNEVCSKGKHKTDCGTTWPG